MVTHDGVTRTSMVTIEDTNVTIATIVMPSGTTATTFSPDQDCTRVEIVTFLYRALGA